MRSAIIAVVAALLIPTALSARPAASGITAASAITDVSAAKKAKKKPAKVKEEYLKAAPSAPPSGTKY